ncbi:MAG: glycoside hydrolase family 3 protein [Oscillospiraceae bacterium]|nr:glycoside hydrolase family 3 protein [Oscillospiraceae bacterium]
MIDYKAKPFYLSDEDIRWVESTLATMSTEEKIGQLFCLTDMITDTEELKALIGKYQPGGFMYRAGNGAEIQRAYHAMNEAASVPMLFPCNLESGGNGISPDGTFFARPLQVAATDDVEQARRLGYVCAREGTAVGCNWAYAPIVDIDFNWRNPITNVRTFGSDPQRVVAMGGAFMDGVAQVETPMAVCIKHFPGDGVDERDHHLMPTVNSLSAEEWMESYGMVYQTLIDKGAQTVMCGHILQPALERMVNPDIRDEDMLPASQSHALLTGILREKLGFNGLITTDATPMVGFSAIQSRADAIRSALMAGADMLVFCKNIDEDYAAVREGLERGAVTMERLDEAVCRSLALKASLGLHRRSLPDADALSALGCAEHVAWAKECAEKAVTLVKDNQHLLPLSPEKTPRIRLTVVGEGQGGGFGESDNITQPLKEALEKAGFAVSLYDYATMERGEIFTAGVGEMKEKFDLSIVAANVATGSNYTSRRIDWISLMAANEPWYMKDIPTMFMSFCNPYHMIDVPFISTFVNCYSSSTFCVEAAVEKLLGKSDFEGINPVDPWCDAWGAKFM